MRVKSAVAKLNMSVRPIFDRAAFKFTSESRENLQTVVFMLFALWIIM